MARDPEKLHVYHLAHALVLQVYALTTALPAREQYGLQAQLRRAAVSIPANIVEGSHRRGAADYARFVDIALGSAAELRYLLTLAGDLGAISGEALSQCRDSSDRVVRSLLRLRTAVARFERSRAVSP